MMGTDIRTYTLHIHAFPFTSMHSHSYPCIPIHIHLHESMRSVRFPQIQYESDKEGRRPSDYLPQADESSGDAVAAAMSEGYKRQKQMAAETLMPADQVYL